MKTCMCLKCKKQYKTKEIGIKLVDSGWGVCPECGGRISRTDNSVLIPLLEELGEKNCAILHSHYSKPENYEYKGKKLKSKPFIFFHILVKHEDELIMLEEFKAEMIYQTDEFKEYHISYAFEYDEESNNLDDVVSQEMKKLISWAKSLKRFKTDPVLY